MMIDARELNPSAKRPTEQTKKAKGNEEWARTLERDCASIYEDIRVDAAPSLPYSVLQTIGPDTFAVI
jgi:hypothetical protein